jgi:N-acetylmuramoyl-L-alanine amidase
MSETAKRPASPRARRAYSAAAASAPLMVAALLAGSAAGDDLSSIPHDDRQQRLPADPAAGPGFTSGTTTDAVPVSHGGRTYKVKAGDTVISIAAAHKVSAPAIIELNNLSGRATIRPGQILSLPEQSAPPKPAGHRVRAGETLSSIARAHGTTVRELQKANAMGDSTVIREGEVLALSGSGATSSRPPTPEDEDLPYLPKSFEGREYPEDVHRAARINKKILLERDAPSKDEVKDLVRSTARQMGVDPSLALAVAQQESGFNQRVVSPANAIGVMQVIPDSGDWAQNLTGRELDLLDAEDNIVAGVAILRWLKRNAESESQALAGYYQGLGSVRENGLYADTQRYVRNVQVTKERFRAQGQDS